MKARRAPHDCVVLSLTFHPPGPANRVYDYCHAGPTVQLPPGGAPGGGGVAFAAVGDGPGCPLQEVNPRYAGLFPLDVFNWPQTNLGAFVRRELATIRRLLACGLAPHFRAAYDEAFCRLLAGGEAERRSWAEELSAAAEAVGVTGEGVDESKLTYGELVSLVWGE